MKAQEIFAVCSDFSMIETYVLDIVRDGFKDDGYSYHSLIINKEYLEPVYQNDNTKEFKSFKITYNEIAEKHGKHIEEQRKTISQRNKGMLENKIELLQEDIECVHMYFKEQKPQVPNEINGKELSIIGKIKYLIGEF